MQEASESGAGHHTLHRLMDGFGAGGATEAGMPMPRASLVRRRVLG